MKKFIKRFLVGEYWSSVFAMAGSACLAVGSIDFDAFTLCIAIGYLIIGVFVNNRSKK